jgi:hypothetical protein
MFCLGAKSWHMGQARKQSSLPGPAADFPFGGNRLPIKAEHRLPHHGKEEAVYGLKNGELPPGIAGAESSRSASLDSKYSMLFREKELTKLGKLGERIDKAEANLAMVEGRLANVKRAGGDVTKLQTQADRLRASVEQRGTVNRGIADQVLKNWFDAPGQKVVLAIELEPGALDDMLRRSVDSNVACFH